MEIAVVGTGEVGVVLGRRWAARGHRVCFGSRDPQSRRLEQWVGASTARVVPLARVAREGQVILLATPWHSTRQVLVALGDVAGKVLIDCTNPLSADLTGLELGHTTSAAEQIAGWAAGARVVKAFNSLSAATMADPTYAGQPASMVYCGDDADAKRIVHQLAAELGYEPWDAGPLRQARYLEPLAMLVIQLAVTQEWGGDCAVRILHR